MPCYVDATPTTHVEVPHVDSRGIPHIVQLFWPGTEGISIYVPKWVLRRGDVTLADIWWVMGRDPDELFALRLNREDRDADSDFGNTLATYASILDPSVNREYGIEIVLRQNLSEERRQECWRRRSLLHECLVFHAMRLHRTELARRKRAWDQN
ncbi:MAG: hypothetical protein OXQ32_01900 [bacterium]|nr:hypothetical protein [bacterium]